MSSHLTLYLLYYHHVLIVCTVVFVLWYLSLTMLRTYIIIQRMRHHSTDRASSSSPTKVEVYVQTYTIGSVAQSHGRSSSHSVTLGHLSAILVDYTNDRPTWVYGIISAYSMFSYCVQSLRTGMYLRSQTFTQGEYYPLVKKMKCPNFTYIDNTWHWILFIWVLWEYEQDNHHVRFICISLIVNSQSLLQFSVPINGRWSFLCLSVQAIPQLSLADSGLLAVIVD